MPDFCGGDEKIIYERCVGPREESRLVNLDVFAFYCCMFLISIMNYAIIDVR